MSRKYKFYDSEKPHFVSFAIVKWTDLFTRNDYVDIVTESLSYCIQKKGLIVNAWCIMTNHVHLIIRSEQNSLSDIMRDLKKFTSYQLYSAIQEHPQESRKEWLLWMFEKAGKWNKNNKNVQVWQQHNQPITERDWRIGLSLRWLNRCQKWVRNQRGTSDATLNTCTLELPQKSGQ